MDPSGLGERGISLWSHLSTGDPVIDALALEIARTADRLDELDSIIQGKGVLNLMHFRLTDIPFDEGDPFTVEVKFNAVMSEAKGQQSALTSLVAKYETTVKAEPTSKRQPAAQDLPDNVSPLDRIMKGVRQA
ncbi:MAG: hypothetical protein ACTH9H_12965 [Galactobacter sp.]